MDLDAVTDQPGTGALNQLWERLAKSLDGGSDFLGVNVRGSVLKASLENVEFIHQRGLIAAQAPVRH